ncbi:hypothetical protein [Cellulomonas sp. ICMP 17802]|uniref:hypothetical protein n=1 Tax=Cellulomonas sp. ICMP 17802 TaxID=3239199 RepID=UPI00351B23DA
MQLTFGVLFGAVLVGMSVPFATDPDGGWLLTLAGVAAGALFLTIGIRGSRRGIDADQDGALVRNMFTSRWVPWSDLVDITFDAVQNQGGGTSYHRLLLGTRHGPVVAQAPGGRTTPGGRLDTARARLLAMRDQATAAGS